MAGTVEEAKNLICELCATYYTQGWVSGTGGGMSIKVGDRIVMAPSGNSQTEDLHFHHPYKISLVFPPSLTVNLMHYSSVLSDRPGTTFTTGASVTTITNPPYIQRASPNPRSWRRMWQMQTPAVDV